MKIMDVNETISVFSAHTGHTQDDWDTCMGLIDCGKWSQKAPGGIAKNEWLTIYCDVGVCTCMWLHACVAKPHTADVAHYGPAAPPRDHLCGNSTFWALYGHCCIWPSHFSRTKTRQFSKLTINRKYGVMIDWQQQALKILNTIAPHICVSAAWTNYTAR